MGFEDRDYMRGSSGYSDRYGSWGNMSAVPPVCKYLVAANIIVFLAQIFLTRPPTTQEVQLQLERVQAENELLGEEDRYSQEELEQYLQYVAEQMPRVSIVQKWAELDTEKVLHGQVWRLLTSAFCHARGSIFHILFNMLFLWWFGPTLERMYGSREFLLFYLTAAMISSLAYVALDLFTGEMVPAIGASGAVMAVTMLYAIFYPRHTIYIMFVIPVEIRWLVVAYVIFDLHPVLLTLAGDQVSTGVAHAAHLGGLAFGFLYWKLNLRLEQLPDYLPHSSSRPATHPRSSRSRPRIRTRRTERLEEEVDAILQKIHEQGQESLTEAERRVLDLASEQYKQRDA